MIQHVQYVIELELYKSIDRIHSPLVVRVGENDSQRIKAKIKRHGEFLNIDCDSARLDIVRENGTWARVDARVEGYTVTCDLPSEAIASAGMARLAYFVFIKGKQVQTTESFALRIENAATENAESDAYFDTSVNHVAEKWAAFESTAEKMESGRRGAENERVNAEDARKIAENDRSRVEGERIKAEENRNAKEAERRQAENERKQRDQEFIIREHERISAEQARMNAERAREQAEGAREQNETTRVTQEGERVNAEQARKTRFEQMIDAAQNVKFKIVEADEDGVPRGEGAAGIIYLVKGTKETAINHYTEWIWYNGKWELFGTSGATVEPITTQDIDKVSQDSTISGTRVLNASALAYLWQKLKDRYQTRAQVDDIARGIYKQNIQSVNSSIQTLTSRADAAQDECKRLDAVKASQLDVSNVRDELYKFKKQFEVCDLGDPSPYKLYIDRAIKGFNNRLKSLEDNYEGLFGSVNESLSMLTRDTGWQVYWQDSQDSSSRIIYKVYGNTVTVSVCVLNISGKWELHVQDSPLTQKFAKYFPEEGLYCACNVIAKSGSKDTGATTTMYVSSRKEEKPYMWFYGNGGGDYYSVGTLTYTLPD